MNLTNLLLGISTALAETTPAAGDPSAEMSGPASIVALLGSLLPMILIFVVFYFILIRPQKKKDKQIKEMLNNLKKGDRICTIGGIYGTIVSLKDDTVTLAVGKDNLSMVLKRSAIATVEDVTIENDSGELLN